MVRFGGGRCWTWTVLITLVTITGLRLIGTVVVLVLVLLVLLPVADAMIREVKSCSFLVFAGCLRWEENIGILVCWVSCRCGCILLLVSAPGLLGSSAVGGIVWYRIVSFVAKSKEFIMNFFVVSYPIPSNQTFERTGEAASRKEMARGNQRENDRAKVRHSLSLSLFLSRWERNLTLFINQRQAQKKLAGQTKGPKESGSSLAARKEAEAEIMRVKNVRFVLFGCWRETLTLTLGLSGRGSCEEGGRSCWGSDRCCSC